LSATGPLLASVEAVQARLDAQSYVADRGLAVSIYLAASLRRPLFLEGEAGVGKTAVAKALAAALDTDLIRLQCYEGLDISHAVYEWDYARQLLELRILEAAHAEEGLAQHVHRPALSDHLERRRHRARVAREVLHVDLHPIDSCRSQLTVP